MRTGQNLSETILTPQNVQSSTFGKLFTLSVDGKVDAQPLVAANVNIPSVGSKNVVFVATEHDSLYAFDADTGTKYWQISMLKSGEASSDNRSCGQVSPEIGITATPAIDMSAGPHGTIYVVAMSKDSSNGYHQRLHAIDVTNGAEQFSGPVDIQATFPGTGDNASGGNVVFDPKQYKNRPGLLIVNGVVYTSWSSHCDIRPYTGWTMGYNQTTLAQTSVFNFTPNGNEGAIWGAGGGASADVGGNLFFQLGNGTFDTTLNGTGFPNQGDYGNAFVKLSLVSGALKAVDYWTMFNTVSESNADEDLGSGGVLILPDVTDGNGMTRHLGAGAGKDRNVYLFDRDNMGKFNPSNNGNIYQSLPSALGGSEFASPAWFNGMLYFGSVGDVIRGYKMTAGLLPASPTTSTLNSFAFPGTTPSISANGTSNAILWAVENSSPAKLHAYNANDLLTELYNSSQAPGSRDAFGNGNKFITPTIVNGKVYVGTPNSVAVFGLLGGSSTPTLTAVNPSSGVQGNGVNVTLTGTNFISGATVAVSGTGVTVSNVVVVSATQITATFTIAGNAATGGRTVSVTTTGGTSNTQPFTVNAATTAPTISKAFNPTSITSGGSSTVTLTLTNGNASALTGGAFTDTLTNMSASGGAVGGTCAGTTPSTLTAGATALSLTGITIPASGSCTVTFSVTSTHVGGNPNATSGVTTTQTPVAGSASNSATLTVTAGTVSPTIAKGFNPASIASGGSSTVTLTLTNSNASALTGGAFTDTLTNMSATGGAVGGTCAGTTPSTLTAGATALSFTGITIPANSSCTVTFSVTSTHVGGNPNATSGVTTTQTPVAGSASNSATLTVASGGGGGLNENFESGVTGWTATGLWHLANNSNCASPAAGYMSATHAYYYGQDASCTYQTTSQANSGGLTSPAVTGITAQSTLQFSYFLQTEGTSGFDTATVFVVPNGGNPVQLTTISTNDTTWHTVSPISLAAYAGQSIQIRFTFNTVDGSLNAFKGWFVDDVTVTATGGQTVSPTISKGFNPASVASGGSSTVTLTLTNSNASALTGGAFTDTLTNMSASGGSVGGTCTGTSPSTLSAGATALSFTGITIPASSSCTVTFSVTSSHVGGNPNTTSGVTTTQTPTAGAASNSATLTVTAGTASPTIAKAFNPTSIASGGSSTVTLTLTNSNASALTGGAFTDTLTNMSASGGSVGGTCTGTTPSTLSAGATALSFTGITIPASSSCTVTFSVTSSHVGGNPNTTSGVTTTQTPTAGTASNSATLTVTGGGSVGLNDNFESGATGWTTTGLWHLANNSVCASPAAGYSSATHAFYYGQDAPCNYQTTNQPNSGSLTSPLISGITSQSTLQFSYFLQTEGAAGFDTANVFAVVSGGGTTLLTTLTTNDTAWHTTPAISLAQFAGQTIQIRFTFDTVDGAVNTFKGWFVDDVVVAGTGNGQPVNPSIAKAFSPVSIASGGTSVVTLTLTNSNATAMTGGAFTDTLVNMTATAGAVGGSCTGTTPSTLVAGATALSFTGINVPASSSCTVTFSVTSTHVGANPNTTSGVTTTQIATAGSASNTATLTVTGAGGGGLNENFESGVTGWTASGLWHLAANSICASPAPGYSSATHAFYYGQEPACNYNTGSSSNTGSLTSPAISGITAQSTLKFSYYLGTEGTSGFDTATVSVVGNGGVTTPLTTLSTNDTSWHTTNAISLAQFAGQTIQIRFTFNTVDGIANGFKGWFVDDAVVVP